MSLLPHHPRKTIDFGHRSTVQSLSLRGGIVSLSTPHPTHGQVLVVPWAQFPRDKFYDQSFVRRYRAKPLEWFDKATDFGLDFGGDDELQWSYIESSCPHSTWDRSFLSFTSTYVASTDHTIQQVTITNSSSHPISLDFSFIANVSLNRAAYTQLTPMGETSIPDSENVASTTDGVFQLRNGNLPAVMTASLHVDGERMPMQTLQTINSLDDVVHYRSEHTLVIGARQMRTMHLALSIDTSTDDEKEALCGHLDYVNASEALQSRVTTILSSRHLFDMEALSSALGGGEQGRTFAFVVARNVDYLLNCCSVDVKGPLGDDRGVCIITDHACLPLGWNRDNYYQTRLLSALLPHLASIVHPNALPSIRSIIHDTLRSHLQWVYATAQRPAGYWARCYLVSGKPKDTVFQLDQQCYPLLELAEYAKMFVTGDDDGTEATFVRKLAKAAVDEVLVTLQQHRWTRLECEDVSEDLWLFKTDETPADDAVEYPFHFSSHILLWHTLKSLAMIQALIPDCFETPVAEWAARVHGETMRSFSTNNPRTGEPMFAYLTSTRGEFQLYHDANDLPSALAPKWGFCDASSIRWKNTLEFAFSLDNKDGFFPDGVNAGLGSVHTRDPWPLGDSQELLYAELSGQVAREETVRGKLARIVQWDGLYPEAIDRHTGATTSKHWFGWPGCFIGTILLDRGARNLASPITDGAQIAAQHIQDQLGVHREAHGDSGYLPPLIVGMQGPQGSGKSFIAKRAKDILSAAPYNLNVACLSTDDLYLDRDGLIQLARQYPNNDLLHGRGLPGTHDLLLGRRVLKAVKAQGGRRRNMADLGLLAPLILPSFDKGAYGGFGDRRPEGSSEEVSGGLDVFIFEGWSQGFMPCDETELKARRSATHDPRHRAYYLDHSIDSLLEVNGLLGDYAKEWYTLISTFVQIVPPNPTQVFEWRCDAEHVLMASNGGRGMTDEEVHAFVARYMVGYELWSSGVRDASQPWAGRGLALHVDKERKVVSANPF